VVGVEQHFKYAN